MPHKLLIRRRPFSSPVSAETQGPPQILSRIAVFITLTAASRFNRKIGSPVNSASVHNPKASQRDSKARASIAGGIRDSMGLKAPNPLTAGEVKMTEADAAPDRATNKPPAPACSNSSFGPNENVVTLAGEVNSARRSCNSRVESFCTSFTL